MVRSLSEEPTARRAISVVMPAYNEGLEIADVLGRLAQTLGELRQRYDVELIVVDDGSTDKTREGLDAFASSHPRTRIYTHSENRGLVEAIKTGTRAALGQAVVVLDADLSYAPEIIEPLVQTLFARGASAVIASPYMRGGRVGNVPFDRLVASRGANWLLSLCVGGRIKTFTGMVRAYERGVILEVMGRRTAGEFNAWVVAELLRDGRRIEEIPAALIWPAFRSEAPSRLTARKLWSRALMVLETMRTMLSAKRPASVK